MRTPQLDEVIPLLGTTFGGVAVGIILRNGFVGWDGETLTAGLLGFAGGLLAFKAAKMQQRSIEDRNSFSFGVRTHEDRAEILDAVKLVIKEKDQDKCYTHSQQFANNLLPKLKETLIGNDPLSPDLAALVAKTSNQLIQTVDTIKFTLAAREKRRQQYSEVTIPLNLAPEITDLKNSFHRLAVCLFRIDDYFTYHNSPFAPSAK